MLAVPPNVNNAQFLAAWLLFILVNAYYGGALTMFFSSSPTLPFETLRQVMDFNSFLSLSLSLSLSLHTQLYS